MNSPTRGNMWLGALAFGAAQLLASSTPAAVPLSVSAAPSPGAFPLVADGPAAALLLDTADAKVVQIAAEAFAGDVERVTGSRPRIVTAAPHPASQVVIVGTLGQSEPIDRLVREGRLDVSAVRGRWESCLLTSVERPLPGVKAAWVVAGSDRRGTRDGARIDYSRRELSIP